MKRCPILILILSFVLAVPARAGEGYRLREPGVEEYLASIPAIITSGNQDVESPYGPAFNHVLFSAMNDEIRWRYPDLSRVDANLLYEMYTFLVHDQNLPGWYDYDHFAQAIIVSWLNQHQPDLNAVSTLEIFEFEVTVIPRDFNGDGQNEWFLQVESDMYRQYLVIARVEGAYSLVESPLEWFTDGTAYWMPQAGFMKELFFGDMTGDGLPEWVLALGGVGANQTSVGWLYVLHWQDGRLVDLAPHDDSLTDRNQEMSYSAPAGGGSAGVLYPHGVSVSLEDTDHNGTVEVLIRQEQFDNWGCTWTSYRTFAYNESHFGLTKSERDYDEVQGCEIRAAEEALWEYDLTSAIQHYERALTLEPTDEYFFGDPEELAGYAHARLAVAYALAGRREEAARTLATLPTRDNYSPTLNAFIAAVESHLGDLMQVCLAAYTAFTFECPPETDACLGSPVNAKVGETVENTGYDFGGPWNTFPDPSRAGCDIGVTLNMSASPAAQLEAAGVTINQTRQLDLDGDGHDEWLIWFVSPDPKPLFLAVEGDHYYVSRPDLSYPDEYTRFERLVLPDNAGNALVQIYFDDETPLAERDYEPEPSSGPQVECLDREGNHVPLPESAWGYVQIWRFEDHELHLRQHVTLCEALTFNDIFPAGTSEMRGWAGEPFLKYTVFEWNEEQERYTLELQPQQKLTLRSFQERFVGQQYQELLALPEPSPINFTEQEQLAVSYYRALSLEALNRPDEALAEYITIYEHGPESWKILAALHLERVEQDSP